MRIPNKLGLIIVFMGLISCHNQKESTESGNEASEDSKDIVSENIFLADPTIFKNGDTYYLYGTSQGPLTERGAGFLVYTSDDLETWEGPAGKADGGFVLHESEAFGNQGFWAPQIFEYNEKFYMAYTANESIAIATSDSPLGPFSNSKEALEAETKQIDPFVFFEDDKVYLYHVRLDEGNRIFVAEMDEDLNGIKPETITECISVEKQWENTARSDWPVAEGPTVLKRDKVYYLVYSANDFRNPDYAVGYATSDSPLGPWKKSKVSPIINKDLVEESGPGHGDVVLGENGEMHYVLHTHFSDDSVHPRKTAVVKLNFAQDDKGNEILQAEEETFTFLESKKE